MGMSSMPYGPERRDARYKLAKLQLLVVDPHNQSAAVVQRVLYTFGFRRLYHVSDGVDALRYMNTHRVDMMFSEWETGAIHSLPLIKAIRTSGIKQARPDIPIIMLTAQAGKDTVQRARDIGVSEFLAKPFSAKTLSQRVIEAIDQPREFVITATFCGPSRRRRGKPPEGTPERRAPRKGGAEVSILPPSRALVKLMDGASAASIISPQVVSEAQYTLTHAEREFEIWVKDDIAKLEQAYQAVVEAPSSDKARKMLIACAYTIQSQSGTFGYALGTQVGAMLIDYIASHAEFNENTLLVIRKHIETISVVFAQQVKNSQSEVGLALIDSLNKLIARFS